MDSDDSSVCSDDCKEQKVKKIITGLIVFSYLCVACFVSIPGPTLLILKDMVKTDTPNIFLVFTVRSFGYVVGCILGGIMFDQLQKNFHRHALIVLLQGIAALTAVAVPFCDSLTSLSIVFFAAGISMSSLDIGFNTYLLQIWKYRSNPYFQTLHFVFGVGCLMGPMLTRAYYQTIESAQNTTSSVNVVDFTDMPVLLYPYVILGGAFALATIMWFLMCIFSRNKVASAFKRLPTEKDASTNFFVYGISTTALLIFCVGCIHLGYTHMLVTFAVTKYGITFKKSTELSILFWSFYAGGGFVTIFLSRKFHPFCLIFMDLVLEGTAAIILVFLGANNTTWLYIGNAVLGLGASALYASTLLWLHHYIRINHRILAILVMAEALAELIIPKILDYVLTKNVLALHYFVGAVPVVYAVIFLSQWFCFFPAGERYLPQLSGKNAKPSRVRLFPLLLHRPTKSTDDDANTQSGPQSRDENNTRAASPGSNVSNENKASLTDIFEPRRVSSTQTQTDDDSNDNETDKKTDNNDTEKAEAESTLTPNPSKEFPETEDGVSKHTNESEEDAEEKPVSSEKVDNQPKQPNDSPKSNTDKKG